VIRGRPIFRSDQTCKPHRVTFLVPESCAEGLCDLARVLRDQQRERTADPFGWRKLSPSAELIVDPECGARYAIRDTGAAGADCYHWTVAVFGEIDPVAAERTAEPADARPKAEAGSRLYGDLARGILAGAGMLPPSKRAANASAAASIMKSTDRMTSSPL